MNIRGIDHIVLRTEQVDAMESFYSKVLGCEVERRLPPEIGLVQLRAGASLIDLVAVDSELGRMGGAPPGLEGRNLDHFCLQVEGLDKSGLKTLLSAHGIDAGKFEERYGAEGFGPSVYIRDPDGNTIELKLH